MESSLLIFVCLIAASSVLAKDNRIPPFKDFPFKALQFDDHYRVPEGNPMRQSLNTSPGTFSTRIREDEMEELRMRLKNGNLNIFTPPPITEVQCHVEIQVTKRVPGQCTKLGGHIPACRTGEYVEVDYNECG